MNKPDNKQRMVLWLILAPIGMLAASFAAVPIYRAFCPLATSTGARHKAKAAPKTASDKIIQVDFDANSNGVPWDFKPDHPSQETRIGKTAMMYFTMTNRGRIPITARAMYNVLPDTMTPYFRKLQCFCFSDQTLQPGESRHIPVVYFLDPDLLKDNDTKNVRDVTLSYTFFASKTPASSSDTK